MGLLTHSHVRMHTHTGQSLSFMHKEHCSHYQSNNKDKHKGQENSNGSSSNDTCTWQQSMYSTMWGTQVPINNGSIYDCKLYINYTVMSNKIQHLSQ